MASGRVSSLWNRSFRSLQALGLLGALLQEGVCLGYPRRNSSCLPSALQVSRLTRLASGQRSTPLAPQFRIWSQNSTKLRVVQVKSWITGLSLLDEACAARPFLPCALVIRLHTRLPMICRAAFVSSARDCSDLNCKRCREMGLRHFAHVYM